MLPKFELDIHTHTLVSGHAYGTIREMAQAAAERGLKLYGVADHAPGVPGTTHPIYFANIAHTVPRTLYGVRMVFGSEINVLTGGHLSLEDRYLKALDYGIVGIHTVCYQDQGREKNTEDLISCMRHPKVFFVSHPDDDHTPLNYEKLVPAAKELHVALEVNNSSFAKPDYRLNCVANYETMLPLCMKYRVPIIVDSDAHDPSAVGTFEAARALLERLDFDPELILNTSVDKFFDFIGYTPAD